MTHSTENSFVSETLKADSAAPPARHDVRHGTTGTPLSESEPECSSLTHTWLMWLVLLVQVLTLSVPLVRSWSTLLRFGTMMLGPLIGIVVSLIWLFWASGWKWRAGIKTVAAVAVPAAFGTFLAEKNMGVALWMYAVPLSLATTFLFVLFSQRWNSTKRALWLTMLIATIWSAFQCVRLDGFDGGYIPDFAPRWRLRHEQTLSAVLPSVAHDVPQRDSPQTSTESEWPMFRGPYANGVAAWSGGKLDWEMSPPQELWRVAIGPGWSSFAHNNARLFTQEQRGDHELVSCFDADTGQAIWHHSVSNRFEEALSGPGPRATPTYHEGRVYSFGAKAVLCAIDATTGREIWRRDLMAEVNAQIPIWGFSGSPVVFGQVVVVYAGGDEPHGLCAFDIDSGDSVWQVPSSGMNFSSAQRIELCGETLAVFGDSDGLFAVAPSKGEVAWRFKPSDWEGPAITQPQQITDDSLVVPLGDGVGVSRLTIGREHGEWSVSEKWSTREFRPSFNDFVVHDGFIYGFDKHIFACVDATTGERTWKRGRYGFGQVLLLDGIDQLLVLTEHGDIALLAANSNQLTELGRLSALEGKTWNHPIVVGKKLFLRNGKEAACYALH